MMCYFLIINRNTTWRRLDVEKRALASEQGAINDQLAGGQRRTIGALFLVSGVGTSRVTYFNRRKQTVILIKIYASLDIHKAEYLSFHLRPFATFY